jgi:hypothetical protein
MHWEPERHSVSDLALGFFLSLGAGGEHPESERQLVQEMHWVRGHARSRTHTQSGARAWDRTGLLLGAGESLRASDALGLRLALGFGLLLGVGEELGVKCLFVASSANQNRVENALLQSPA